MCSHRALSGVLAFSFLAAWSVGVHAAGSNAPAPAARSIVKIPPRKPFVASERARADVADFPGVRFFGDDVEAYRRASPSVPGPWLVLSAGGSDGAFGAGVVEAWTRSGAEPAFSAITGVSTGAMIAVYAFAGTKYAPDLERAYTGITSADVFEMAPTQDSLVDDWPLRDTIAKRVTPNLLADIAAQQATGRRLFIVTTDLDAGRPVVWNMGAIAAHGGPRALALFRAVLLASSSIPGVFQPVSIKSAANGRQIVEMHADGGITAPFYLAPEATLMSRAGEPSNISSVRILFNGKLSADFSMTDADTLSVLGRSFGLALRAGARAELGVVARWAARANIPATIGSIDPAFDIKSKGAFDPDYMKALFKSGEQAAADGDAARPLAGPGARAEFGENLAPTGDTSATETPTTAKKPLN